MHPFIAISELIVALITTEPRVFEGDEGADKAELHVYYAEQAAASVDDPLITPSLLLAIARVESNYDPRSTSRVVNGSRVTGVWPKERPTGVGPRFCGVMQTIAGDRWVDCMAQRDLATGYLTGAEEIKRWLGWAHKAGFRGSGLVRAALRGHACGLYGLTHPCKDYDGRVLRVKARLDRLSAPST